MPAHLAQPITTPHRFAALLSIDPASVSDCGIAVRLTGSLADVPTRGRLPYPQYVFEGPVFNTRMHDDLACFLSKTLSQGDRVKVVCAGTMFGNRTIARSLGRCSGLIEGLLADLNVYDPAALAYVNDAVWRKSMLPTFKTDPTSTLDGRAQLKAAAIDAVATLYGERCGDNLAEAILLNDYAVLDARKLWAAKTVGKKAA